MAGEDGGVNPETVNLLRDLADRLGTTSERLWEVMVRQAPISSATTAALLLVGWVAVVSVAKLGWAKRAILQSDAYEFHSIVLGTFLAVSTLALIIVSVFSVNMIVTGFLNPEYVPLREILYRMPR